MCLNPQVVGVQPTSATPSDVAVGTCVCVCVRRSVYKLIISVQSSCSVACSCGDSPNSQPDVTNT